MRLYPAVDVSRPCSADDVLVAVDDFSPSALEERADGVRVFFQSPDARDAACAALRGSGLRTSALEVDDEDWARRSQEALQPVTVGRITVLPFGQTPSSQSLIPNPQPLTPNPFPFPFPIVIQPSTGFGTGHHATTRYCLFALQQ